MSFVLINYAFSETKRYHIPQRTEKFTKLPQNFPTDPIFPINKNNVYFHFLNVNETGLIKL